MTDPDVLLHAALDGVRGLVLDVDDTIVDTRGAMVAAGTVAAASVWPGQGRHHRAMAERYHADPGRWFPRYADGTVGFTEMRHGRLAEVADAFGLGLPDGGHAAYEDAYAPAFRAAQRLFPDVPALLERARALALPVGLLTNSAAEPTRVKLEALGLQDEFDAVVTTDTLGVGKPDPRTYREACRRIGVRPGDAVCIGDSLPWDVLGAFAAGLRAVWLDRDGAGAPSDGGPPVARVRDLREVAAALGA